MDNAEKLALEKLLDISKNIRTWPAAMQRIGHMTIDLFDGAIYQAEQALLHGEKPESCAPKPDVSLDQIRRLYQSFLEGWEDILAPNSFDCFLAGFIEREVLIPKLSNPAPKPEGRTCEAWVNVKDRKPKPHDWVLVYLNGDTTNPMYVAWRTKEDNYYTDFFQRELLFGVTRWMPLPNKPAASDGEGAAQS